jgi:cardiolipin synthase A/B
MPASPWIALLTAGLVVWVAIIGVVIVLQRRSAAATLAWLLVLAFLPVIGLIIYRLIGPLRLERKRLERNISRRAVHEVLAARALLSEQDDEHRQLALVAIGLGESSPLRAEDVELFFDGDSAYTAILAAVAAATHHIHLEYYIWEPDKIGTELRDALVARAKAGVQVRMIVDGTGSSALKRRWLAPLREAGVEVAWFNPIRLRTLRLRRPDFRTHRKIVVCDGRVGFTGGMNITDDHSASRSPGYFRDTHMRVTGAAVWALQRLWTEDWSFAAGQLCPIDEITFPTPTANGAHLVQVVGSGPDSSAFAIHKAFFTAINQSTDRLWMTTPYFVPDEALLMAITSAALRDVDVRLIVPKRGDSRLVDLAARSYFPELLEAGVRIFEYEARFIHAKTMVCDDDVAIVGTANLDNRSFRLNFEVAAIIFGTETSATLASAFERDQHGCREISRDDLARQSLIRRFGQASARLMSPLL